MSLTSIEFLSLMRSKNLDKADEFDAVIAELTELSNSKYVTQKQHQQLVDRVIALESEWGEV